MNISKCVACGAVIALLGILSSPASATVEVLEAEALLDQWVLYHGSHSPCSGASWHHFVEEGTTFDLQTTGFEGGCLESLWEGHCSSEGFAYSGEILPRTSGIYGWYIHFQCEISVLLHVMTPNLITATRAAEGIYTPSAHTVTVTLPDGSSDILLGSDPGIDNAERLLGPGIYRVTFSIDSDWSWSIPFSYSGLVEVNWGDTVGQDTRPWGQIKSLYRF